MGNEGKTPENAGNGVTLPPAEKGRRMKRVLFVCTGNTCRSPMAEKCFDAAAKDTPWRASSAGLNAAEGTPMSADARTALAECGIDGGAFASRMVTGTMVEDCQLILTMSRAHQAELCRRYPQAAGKCHTVMELAGGGGVSDPFGMGIAAYRRALAEIRDGVTAWLNFLNGNDDKNQQG